jgi:poly [ADP-ribose] polymerase 10/14/15
MFERFGTRRDIVTVVLGRYRRKKLKTSRAQKAEIAKVREELQHFKDSVIGMRSVSVPFGPGSGAGAVAIDVADEPLGPARWYWEESPQRIQNHANVKPPFWVPYDAAASSALEGAHAARKPELWLGDVYVVDFAKMTQTNTRSGFGRNISRDAPEKLPSRAPRAAADREAASPDERPDDIADDEPFLYVDAGAVIQISQQRDDGWGFGSVVDLGDGAAPPELPEHWSPSSGWFPLAHTDPPSSEQLAELQKALGGGGADALATPKYWDEVKDPLVVEYFKLDPRSDEFQRAAGVFLLEDDLRERCDVLSIERVQNISLWQSYCVKKSATVAREADPAAATRKYVRCWLFHGAPGDVVPKILQQGFNRSFCGKNATFFGKGVYFARDASYSAYPLYCRPDDNGVQSIFLCRVVIGQYCQGRKDALTPDIRDDSRNLLFDSTVNHVVNPEIFVTYHDAQAYPEYLIKFKQSGPVGGHPQTGNRQHPRYKNWVTELEEAR